MASLFRRAFTLVELMVVVAIIGLLMALLLPAVNSARESGRRSECLNKMREIATAVLSFEAQQNRFPGWREGGINVGNGVDNKVSWTVRMLPHLGRQDVYERWRRVGPFNVSLRGLLVCPSDVDKLAATGPATSYLANSGRQDNPNLNAGVPGPDWRANAVFLDKHGYIRQLDSAYVQYSPRQDTSYIKNNDGLGTTLMLSESIVPGTVWDAADFEYRAGMIFWDPSSGAYQPLVHPINAPGTGSAYDLARPSSNHPGGVNVIFASGKARFVPTETDYRVYVALMTPNGGAAREPGSMSPSSNAIRNQPKLTEDSY